MIKNIVFVFSIFIILASPITDANPFIKFIDNSKVINSSCDIPNTQEHGTCMRAEDCPLQFSDVRKISPETCFFERSTPIVCCPNIEKPNNPTRQEIERPKWFYYEIAEEKCSEFYNVTIDISPCLGIGGFPAEDGEYPYMAALGWIRGSIIDFKCGGFLIDKNIVVTAAHCLRTNPNIVRLGGLRLTSRTLSSDDIPVSQVYIHPDYNPKLSYNDIAILKLASNANPDVSMPACLWHRDEIDELQKYLIAVGFGVTFFGGPTSDVLIKVNLTLYENDVCEKVYPPDVTIPSGIIDSHLCAGNPKGEIDTCPGDSGGPIGAKRWNACFHAKEVPFVMGITSFGQGCGGGTAAIYTRISSFVEWIVKTVWPDYIKDSE